MPIYTYRSSGFGRRFPPSICPPYNNDTSRTRVDISGGFGRRFICPPYNNDTNRTCVDVSGGYEHRFICPPYNNDTNRTCVDVSGGYEHRSICPIPDNDGTNMTCVDVPNIRPSSCEFSFSSNLGSLMDRLNRGAAECSRSSGGRRRYHTYTIGSSRQDDDGIRHRTSKPDPSRTLQVKEVDLHLVANGRAHHTTEYDASDASKHARPQLVARRGQPFNMTVLFNRCYDPVNDDLKLIFQADMESDQPMKSKGTHVDILLSDKDETNKWGAKILSNEGPKLTVTVFTPPALFVGKWNLSIDVVEKDETATNVYSYIHPDYIYILFNPWCKDDAVYMDNKDHLKEYVLNEYGKLYTGSSTKITAKPWYFGQFDTFVLDVALALLDKGGLKWSVRGNPIAVVRKLAALVNSDGDGGVLLGNWSGDYTGGRSPLSWTGSVAILQRYFASGQAVKFGQCWVFSGVVTTVMRALGIPCRSVTNFLSAHDTDGSVTIDYHFNSKGEPEKQLNHDSIWNFHVWNDVWMSRPDLPKGYGGWQAVDATPQEASDGVYVCGPVSVQAIRQGEVNMPFDAPFVYAEVNADITHWVMYDDGNMVPVGLKKNSVGKFISTKACNSDLREDVTQQYKPPENSAEERASVRRANQTGSSTTDLFPPIQEDVVFTVEQDSDRTWVGQDFVVGLRIKNNSSKSRSLNGRIVVTSMFYTGVTCDQIKTETLSDSTLVVKGGKECSVKCVVKPSDYLDKLKDCCMLDVTFMAQVAETGQAFSAKENFRLRKPHLTIKAPRETEVGKQFMVDISFVNPLDKMLTDCVVEVDGLSKDLSFPQGTVSSKGTFVASIPVTATKKGNKELIAIFASKQLEDINGSHPIFVRSA